MNLNPRTPTRVVPKTPKTLEVNWDNDEKFELPYFELRLHCPCAACVDEKTGKRTLKPEDLSPEIRLMGAEPVGRYALGLRWSDGHSTGQVHFERLHELCLRFGKPISA